MKRKERYIIFGVTILTVIGLIFIGFLLIQIQLLIRFSQTQNTVISIVKNYVIEEGVFYFGEPYIYDNVDGINLTDFKCNMRMDLCSFKLEIFDLIEVNNARLLNITCFAEMDENGTWRIKKGLFGADCILLNKTYLKI